MPEEKTIEKKFQVIFDAISNAVASYDIDSCINWCRKAIEENADALDAMVLGLSRGMEKVKELFSRHEYYIPELLLCTDTLYAGLDILKPHIENDPERGGKKMVIGVVEGDIHDIGKNLVKAMFIAKGWEVHDLGNDVKPERFMEAQRESGAGLVALSALMSTSMSIMPEIISKLKASDSNVRIIVGGAPLSQELAVEFGAHGYAPDASTAVRKAEELFKVYCSNN